MTDDAKAAMERETLERKDRDELAMIVEAMGGKVTSRMRKATLIDQILELTGVTADDAGSDAKGADAEKSSGDGGATSSGGKGDGASSNGSRAKDADAKASGSNDAGSKDASSKDSGSKDTGSKDSGSKDSGSKGGEPNGKAKGGDGGSDTKAKSDSTDDGGKAASGGDADRTQSDDGDDEAGGRRRRRRGRNRDGGGNEEYSGEPIPVTGVLDLRDDGYGFLRVDGLLPSKDDCYVSVKQVRQFGLRKGDVVTGGARPAMRNEKNPAIMRIDAVNDVAADESAERPVFEELTPVFASESIDLSGDSDDLLGRALDLLAPVGKGSRVLVVGPPRTGATTLVQHIAKAVETNADDCTLIVVQVDARPEEITEMSGLLTAGTVHSTSHDASADEHVNSAELAVARARRLAEAGTDVVVLVDGLSRLARAAHALGNASRSLGGLDLGAIETAKRVLATGRTLTGAGSVTVVATTDDGSASDADRAILDTVTPVATTVITLDPYAADRHEFPALSVPETSTLRADLLVDDEGAADRAALRRALAADEGSDPHTGTLARLLQRLRDTGSNEELLASVRDAAS